MYCCCPCRHFWIVKVYLVDFEFFLLLIQQLQFLLVYTLDRITVLPTSFELYFIIYILSLSTSAVVLEISVVIAFFCYCILLDNKSLQAFTMSQMLIIYVTLIKCMTSNNNTFRVIRVAMESILWSFGLSFCFPNHFDFLSFFQIQLLYPFQTFSYGIVYLKSIEGTLLCHLLAFSINLCTYCPS